jgi:hypothetical protein
MLAFCYGHEESGMTSHRTRERRRHGEAASFAGVGHRLALATALVGAATTANPAVQAGEMQVEVTENRLTLEAEDVAVADVLQAIGEAAAIEVVVRGELGNVTRRSLVEEPLAPAIRRLVGQHSVLMLYEKDASGEPQLREVRVQAAGTATAATAEEDGGQRRRGGRTPIGQIRNYQQLTVMDNDRRVEAIRALARTKDEAATGVLAEALVRDDNVAVRRLAANALSSGDVGDAAVEALTAALGDDERSIRIQAMRGLTVGLGDASAPLLAEVVRSDGDPAVRRAAVQLASSMEGDQALEVIELAVDDDDDTVRRIAEAALNR